VLLFPRLAGSQTGLPACLQCPRLKAIQVLGAGVDSLLSDASIPRNIPLLRVIDPLMAERMATWIMWGVINAQVRASGLLQEVNVGTIASTEPLALGDAAGAGRGRPCSLIDNAAPVECSEGPHNCVTYGSGMMCREYGMLKVACPFWLQRKCDDYWRAQQERRWDKDIENYRSVDNSELRVGIMGLGALNSMRYGRVCVGQCHCPMQRRLCGCLCLDS